MPGSVKTLCSQYHRSADQRGEGDAGDGDHRQQRVAEDVPPHDYSGEEALGPCRSDVLLPHDFKDGVAGHAREEPRTGVPQHQRGPDELRQVPPRLADGRLVARGRAPREETHPGQEHQRREPEVGHRDARQREDAHGVVDPRVLPKRGHDAQRYAEDERRGDAHEAQLQGHGQPVQELAPDTPAGDEGVSPVQRGHVDGPGDVLPPEGPVEPQRRPEGCTVLVGPGLGRRLGAGAARRDNLSRVAGGCAQRREDGDGDQQQREQALQQPAEHVDPHVHGERVPAALRRRNARVTERAGSSSFPPSLSFG